VGDDENAFSEVTDATRGDFDGDPGLDRWAKPRRSISIGDFVDSSAEDKNQPSDRVVRNVPSVGFGFETV
jgi:hypothetical protein